MIIKTSLKESKGKGIGLFSEENIKKGKVIWVFNPIVDIIINKKDIPKKAKEFYDIYSVDYGKDKLMINTDNARFINHSKNPNIKSLGKKKENIAIKNIKKGEEITMNYEELEKNTINFKNIEIK